MIWGWIGSGRGTYTTENLDNTRREILLSQFTKLKIAVWGERRRLDDDRVSCEQGWSDLACSQMNRKVPRNNSDCHAQGCISNDNLFIVILLHNLFLELDIRQGP